MLPLVSLVLAFSSLISLSSQDVLATSPEIISIKQWVATERQCVSTCVTNLGQYNEVGCSINSCLCRPDVQTSAISYISTCIRYADGCNGIDLSAATSKFDQYCSAYTKELQGLPISIPAAATSGTATGVTHATATPGTGVGSTPSETGTNSNSATSSSSSTGPCGSLTCTAVGGITVGSLLPVILVILKVLQVIRRRKDITNNNNATTYGAYGNNNAYGSNNAYRNNNVYGKNNAVGNTTTAFGNTVEGNQMTAQTINNHHHYGSSGNISSNGGSMHALSPMPSVSPYGGSPYATPPVQEKSGGYWPK